MQNIQVVIGEEGFIAVSKIFSKDEAQKWANLWNNRYDKLDEDADFWYFAFLRRSSILQKAQYRQEGCWRTFQKTTDGTMCWEPDGDI
jgi:hypothetical protein